MIMSKLIPPMSPYKLTYTQPRYTEIFIPFYVLLGLTVLLPYLQYVILHGNSKALLTLGNQNSDKEILIPFFKGNVKLSMSL